MSKFAPRSSVQFGEAIVSKGYASAEDLERALAKQKQMKIDGEKPLLIGMLMLQMGIITIHQLISAINSFRSELNLFISEDAVRITVHLKANFRNQDKVIAFSSARAREGVSRLVTQFAIGLSLMGDKKILLIDANAKHPSLHQAFRCDGYPGLFDILERNLDFKSVIRDTSLPTLSLMPSGTTPQSSYGLFLTEAYSDLINNLRSEFDYVIVDTAPILDYPDSSLVVSRTDGLVFVISSGKTSKNDVVSIKRGLDNLGVRLYGYVLSEAG